MTRIHSATTQHGSDHLFEVAAPIWRHGVEHIGQLVLSALGSKHNLPSNQSIHQLGLTGGPGITRQDPVYAFGQDVRR